ncbi:MAG: lamin tail domain-containing protein [Myxococcales bacterium]|nr:lamin tail domain-containing protein [Myxococcales bacterium]
MRRLPWFVLMTAGVAGCPQPTNRPDVTQPDVVVQDRPSDTGRPDTSMPPADMVGPDATEPMDVQSMPDADMPDGMSGPSDGIRAVQAAAAGMVNIRLENVMVTYVTPLIMGANTNNDPAGFAVQAEPTGPALFVGVDPATIMPTPTAGDRVSFTVTMTRAQNNGMSRWVSALSMYTRVSGGNPLASFVQDLSGAADAVSALGTYEYELARFTGTITDNGANSGAAFRAFAVTSAGIPAGDANLRVRMPEALANMLGVRMGCRVTLGPAPFWRFRDVAQPSAWRDSEVMLSMCPPVSDAGTDAADARTDSGVVTDSGVPMDSGVVVDAGDSGVVADTGVDAPGCTPRIVVNEVQTRGGAGDANAEFVEILNVGTCAVNLNGWALRYAAGSATTTGSAFWTGTAAQTLNPGQYAVARSSVVTAGPASALDLIASPPANLGFSDTQGGVGLYNGSTRIDSVTWAQSSGSVGAGHLFREGMPAVMPASGMINAIARVPNGADTDANSVDFTGRTASSIGVANP